MKKININFGTGKERVTHTIEANTPDELLTYLKDLKNAGWKLDEITSITGGWTF